MMTAGWIEKWQAYWLRAALRFAPGWTRAGIARRLLNAESPKTRGFRAIVRYGRRLKFILNTKDAIGARVFFVGEYERETNWCLAQVCRPGDVVVEAGANIGTETLLIAEMVGPTGRVFAFEPVPHVREMLAENVALNHLEHVVHVEAAALGACYRSTMFYVSNRSAFNQGMSSKYRFGAAEAEIQVQEKPLDDWWDERGRPPLAVLKMDVQGGELSILKGASNVLRNCRPAIYLEATEEEQRQAGKSVQDLFNTLDGLDYVIWAFRPNRLRPLPLRRGQYLIEGNWVAIAREKATVLPWSR